MSKPSFFERLTGAINVDDDDFEVTDETSDEDGIPTGMEEGFEESVADAELAVDVLQTPDKIIIRTMVAGVEPSDLDVDITREMVTISGHREKLRTISNEEYFHQELYWGTFSRSILLPEEIEVEEAVAEEKHGLLVIELPKIDKHRKTKLKVKTG
jgi:HSP20 family protein